MELFLTSKNIIKSSYKVQILENANNMFLDDF
eukprot:UN06427